jgi:hypothetical protein
MTAHRASNFYATVAISCLVYSALALILLHLLRPDYPPVSHMISDYAVGRYGWIMTTWFIGMSISCLMLALGLKQSGPNTMLATLGAILLGVASAGLLVSAAFPTDLDDAPTTQAGHIHTISFLLNVASILIATVLTSLSFGRHPRWRSYRATALTLAAFILVAFVIQFLTLHRGAPYGLANRLFVALLFLWLFATSIRLRTVTRDAGGT